MKFLSYHDVIIGIMKDNQCTMRQALTDDMYGARNARKYLKAYKLNDAEIQFYLDIATGKEPDKALSV